MKAPFLEIYESTEECDISVVEQALKYLIYRQIQLREKKKITLATPNISEISKIVGHISSHIMHSYEGKGASRLPVLAIYATLKLVSNEINRFESKHLKELESHSAADSRTKSAGDIEIASEDGDLFEALEIKHGITITEDFVLDIAKKIAPFQLSRYYILTTANPSWIGHDMQVVLDQIHQKIGCEIIVNGVMPTIHYYLRLVKEPQDVYKYYTALLLEDKSVSHEHREVWNKVILA